MDFEALKESIKNIEVKVYENQRHKDIIEESSGYYTLPCTKEPFDGEVIKLSGDEFYLFFQRYSQTTEDKFRDKLESMDSWLSTKPYKVQKNWMHYVPKWLMKKK